MRILEVVSRVIGRFSQHRPEVVPHLSLGPLPYASLSLLEKSPSWAQKQNVSHQKSYGYHSAAVINSPAHQFDPLRKDSS